MDHHLFSARQLPKGIFHAVIWTLMNALRCHFNQSVELINTSLYLIYITKYQLSVLAPCMNGKNIHFFTICGKNITDRTIDNHKIDLLVATISYGWIIHQRHVLIFASWISHMTYWQVKLPYLKPDREQSKGRCMAFDNISFLKITSSKDQPSVESDYR